MPPVTPHFPNDFPRRLARLRVLLGLTWKGLVEEAGLNLRTLHRWRPSTRPAPAHLLVMLDFATEHGRRK